MQEFLRQLLTGIGEAWQRLSVNAKVQIVITALLTFVLIGAVVVIGAQPQFARLFTRLDLSESNEIIIWLADNNIPYKLQNGGQTILVPIQDIQSARVGLVDLGLPRTQGVTAPGLELFTTRDLMTNEWLQNVDFMRAVQGELQRQLNEFDFINKSFVFIREAPEQLFVSEQTPSQASVNLDTNRMLTPREVKAVLNIISSFGGHNLNTKNITLTTSDGTLLHSPVEDEFASLATDQLEAQVAREKQREETVRRAFQGLGVNAIIRVSATMDWSSKEKTTKQVTDGTVLSSLDSSTITSSSEGPPEGAPGAIANIPEGLGAPGQTEDTSEMKELIENFEPSESITKTASRPGTVRRFLVSAFIEGNYTPILDEDGQDTGQTEYEPLTNAQIATYTQFIANAVGEGAEATDIVVSDHPFKIDRLAAAQVTVEPVGVPWMQNRMVQLGIQGALILGAFFMIRLFMRRAMILPTVEEAEVLEMPEASAEDMRRMEVAAEVERLAREEPEAVASLLRSWMAEEE